MNQDDHQDYEKPPFFDSWAGMYALVLGNLFFLIILFYLLTVYYS
ncbi:MAG: hypothetical protein ACLFQO_11035 [Cyclobacteriaceae bacterium]